MNKFYSFLKRYYYIWGALMIVMGIFLAFFGNKFVNSVIYIVGTLASFLVITSLFYSLFMKNVSKQWVQWVIVGLVLIGANLIGFVLVKFRKYGIAILAGWGGAMAGFLITTTFVVKHSAAYWGIVIGCAVVCAILAFFTERKVIMLVTALSGSYMLIRGISLYAGGFPNEVELHEEFSTGVVTWSTFDKAFYGYLAGIVVLFGGSLYF